MFASNNIYGFFRLFSSYKISIAIITVFSIISSGIGVYIPREIGIIIDTHLESSANFIPLASMLITFTIFVSLQAILVSRLTETIAYDLRNFISEKFSTTNYSQFLTVEKGKFLSLFTTDVEAIKNVVATGMVTLISAMILLLGSVVSLLLLNLEISIVIFAVVIAILSLFRFIFPKISKLFKLSQKNNDKLNQVITENINAFELVRILDSQEKEIEKFYPLNKYSYSISIRILNLFGTFLPTVNLIANISLMIVIAIGSTQVINTNLTLGEFSSIYFYVNILITPVFILGFLSTLFSRSYASYQRISETIEIISKQTEGTKKNQISSKITLKDVNLKIASKQVLKAVDLEIKLGKKLAIVGPTGSGKTKLIETIMGLSDYEGKISVDDIDLKQFDKKYYISQFSIIFQENIIFNSTLKSNIILSSRFDQSKFDQVIRIANLEKLIKNLPKMEDTMVSEKGINLSGGQKQRIGLARALYKNSKIIVLDDFSSRVDVATEKEIYKKFNQYYPNRTIINITQKISSVINYDQIVLVIDGEIICKGTHEELLKESIDYQKLFESQKVINNE